MARCPGDISDEEKGFQTGFRRGLVVDLTPLNRGALFLLLLVIISICIQIVIMVDQREFVNYYKKYTDF